VCLYQALFDANGAQMVHWLRTDNPTLGGEMLVIMENQGRLADVLTLLEGLIEAKTRH